MNVCWFFLHSAQRHVAREVHLSRYVRTGSAVLHLQDFAAWGTPAKASKNYSDGLLIKLFTGWHTAELVAGELPPWTRFRLLS
jgi:hypothetical protein